MRLGEVNYNYVMTAHSDYPDKGLANLALAMANYDARDFLGLLAAGLLEDLLSDPSPEFLNRIVVEARKTPRIRWLLSRVSLHAIAKQVRAPVAEEVGDMRLKYTLPPAPY
jgi:hypothetical protein